VENREAFSTGSIGRGLPACRVGFSPPPSITGLLVG